MPARPQHHRDTRVRPQVRTVGDLSAWTAAVAPYDEAVRRSERRWGIGRLPGLVDPALAARYGGAVAALNAAIEAEDVAACIGLAANCVKGIAAMEAAAEAAGAPEADPRVIEYEVDGLHFGILPDVDFWQTVSDARPDLKLYSLREVGMALKAYAGVSIVGAVLQEFPGATITARVDYANGGDEIPF